MVSGDWISMDNPPDGAGGQVWVAYPNPHHPDGWDLRVQWTPIQSEHAVEPLYWRPCERPPYPPKPQAAAPEQQEHKCRPERDANMWRAVCSCGWRSILCRFKAGAGRAAKYHMRGELTVSTKRSRMPGVDQLRHDKKITGWYRSRG